MSRCRLLRFFITLLAIWRVGAILSAQQAAPTPSFEVASVKANTSGRILTTVDPQPGRLTITNIRLRVLIQNAYQLQSAQIVGEPDWIEDARFDIVAKLADDEFSPTFLRNATAYGVSPRLRADVVVNNLVGIAFTTGEVLIQSDGTPWRPLVHIEDIARAFIAALHAPRELVHNQAFNVGRTTEGYSLWNFIHSSRLSSQ